MLEPVVKTIPDTRLPQVLEASGCIRRWWSGVTPAVIPVKTGKAGVQPFAGCP